MRALRFNAGEYGKAKLRALSTSASVPKDISETAKVVLADNYPRWDDVRSETPQSTERLRIYPRGHLLSDNLKDAVEAAAKQRWALNYLGPDSHTFGLFIDLTEDGKEDFAVVTHTNGMLFVQDADAWKFSSDLVVDDGCQRDDLIASLEAGHFSAVMPRIADLTIGSRTYGARPAKKCQ
jgi:hypothetical protein